MTLPSYLRSFSKSASGHAWVRETMGFVINICDGECERVTEKFWGDTFQQLLFPRASVVGSQMRFLGFVYISLYFFDATVTARTGHEFLMGYLDPDVVYPLPANVTPPAHCHDFTIVCKAEAAQRYEDAFAFYESRYPDCGDIGWTNTGNGTGSR